jgi:hypothetical protein
VPSPSTTIHSTPRREGIDFNVLSDPSIRGRDGEPRDSTLSILDQRAPFVSVFNEAEVSLLNCHCGCMLIAASFYCLHLL